MKHIEYRRESKYSEYDGVCIMQIMCPYHHKKRSDDDHVDDSQRMNEKRNDRSDTTHSFMFLGGTPESVEQLCEKCCEYGYMYGEEEIIQFWCHHAFD